MKKHILLLTVISFSLLNFSCLVDDEEEGKLQSAENSVYLLGFSKEEQLESYFEDIGPVEVNVPVHIMGGNYGQPLSFDTTVNYIVDPSSTAVAGNEYNLTGSSFVIPAGSTFGELPIQINTGGLDPDTPTTLTLRLTSANGATISTLNEAFTITFVGCQSDHAGLYSNPDVTGGTATMTQIAPNTFQVSAIPYITSGGNPLNFTFTNVCGEITITEWQFSGTYLIIGSGEVDELTGALSFNYIIYAGLSVDTGVLQTFDFSGPADTSTYTPIN